MTRGKRWQFPSANFLIQALAAEQMMRERAKASKQHGITHRGRRYRFVAEVPPDEMVYEEVAE